jgi:hypothetical protein
MGHGGYHGYGGYYGHGNTYSTRIWMGPGWAWGQGWWGLPAHPYYPYYPYYSYYPASATVVDPAPPTYAQPSTPSNGDSYWYYCQDPPGFYPYVKECPEGWMKVVLEPPSPGP